MLQKIIKYIKQGTFFYHLWIKFFIGFKFYKLYDLFSNFKKVNPRKIIFCNFFGSGYGNELKYIAEYIIEHNLDYELVWLVDNNRVKDLSTFPQNIRLIKFLSYKSLKEYASAGIWIDNCRKSYFPKKKNNQLYIQTWHGNFSTKKIEKDATLPSFYVEIAKRDSDAIDFIPSGSRTKTKIYETSFWYAGKIIECGTPNCDIFLDNEKVSNAYKKVRKYYELNPDDKILLYGPTFRNSQNMDCYSINYEILQKTLEKKFGGNWKILTRLHPNLVPVIDKLNIPSSVVNATFYPDMQELQCASDSIITDFSGFVFEYFLLNRPVFLYFADYEDYMKNDREFYVTPEESPFPLAKTNDELSKNILAFDKKQYLSDVESFREKHGFCETGHSCETIVQEIEKFVQREK